MAYRGKTSKRTAFRMLIAVTLAACGSNLGTLGVINDEDAGTDGGREAAPGSDSGVDAASDAGSNDAAPDVVDASVTRGSPDGGRAMAVACEDAGRPVGQPQDAGGCKADIECDAGIGGRCDWRGFTDGGSANVCTYDTCFSASTCTTSATSVCGCGVGSLSKQNLCLSNSNCRTDSQCPTGEHCVLSSPIVLEVGKNIFEGNEVGGINYAGQALGYFCTTPQDNCLAGNRPDGTAVACTYNSDAKRWQWAEGP